MIAPKVQISIESVQANKADAMAISTMSILPSSLKSFMPTAYQNK